MPITLLKNIIALNALIQVIAETQKENVPRYQIVQFGQDTILDCISSDGNNSENVFWTKSARKSSNSIESDFSKDFTKDVRYSVDEDHSLTIRNVRSKDVGSYSCNVVTENGYRHNTIILNISQQSPEIRRKPRPKSAKSEQDIQFRCLVSGYPEPSIRWLHNGSPIIQEKDGNTRFKTTSFVSSTSLISASLKIKNVKKSDEGEYTCLAQNDMGKDRGKEIATKITKFIENFYISLTIYPYNYNTFNSFWIFSFRRLKSN